MSERETFNKLVREGVSLRRLEVFFSALGLKVKKDTIASHIYNMGVEVKEQRKLEKAIKLGHRVRDFFTKPEATNQTKCKHLRTEYFFDINSEKVCTKCLDCGAVLDSGIDPEENLERMNGPDRNLKIWRSLQK